MLSLIDELRWSRNHARSDREYHDGRTVLRARPQFLIVDPSSRCNARCLMCPVSFRPPGEAGTDLAPALFTRIRPFLATASHVNLFASGEPTLCADLVTYLRQARRRCTGQVWVGSNGKDLAPGLLAELQVPGMGLQLSVDGGTAGVFESIRRGVRFSELCRTLERVSALRGSGRVPALSFSCTMSKRNIHDLANIFALAERFRVDQLIVYDQDPESDEEAGYVLDQDDRSIFEAQRAAIESTGIPWANDLGFRGAVRRTSTPIEDRPREPLRCLAPWKVFYLRAEGDVRTCCTLRSSMGDLNRSSLEEVWNGPAYVALRQAFVTQKGIPQACFTCVDPLRTYPGLRSRPWLGE